MRITFVKKILADGSPCQKCRDVENRLREAGHLDRMDEVLVADERDPESAGMKLAAEVGAERAPFFVVDDNGARQVYTVYFKFAREVLGKESSAAEKGKEILNDNPDLDFI